LLVVTARVPDFVKDAEKGRLAYPVDQNRGHRMLGVEHLEWRRDPG
jgi:hypothetical protein